MNIWAFNVACITLIAFVAHVLIGTRETTTIEPTSADRKLTTNWVQAMCAFQMLSVDLLVVAAALFGLAFVDLGPLHRPAVLLLSVLFSLWGIVWIVQMKWLNRPIVTLWRLPHRIVWFSAPRFSTSGVEAPGGRTHKMSTAQNAPQEMCKERTYAETHRPHRARKLRYGLEDVPRA